MKHLRHRLNQQGFSLVELAITVAIVGILAAVATPMFKSGPDKRLKAAARDLWTDVRFVRMESVKRRTDIGIQFVPMAYSVTGGVGSYIIFLDDASGGGIPGNGIMDGTEGLGIGGAPNAPIKTVLMPRDVSLINTNFANNSIGYNSRALPNGINTGNVQLRNARSFYRLTLSQAGSFRIERSRDNGATWSEN